MPVSQDFEDIAANPEAPPQPPWWQSEAAFARLRVAGRLVRRSLKYSPDQPRVPAGQPGGGQWISVGDGGGEASPAAPASTSRQVTVGDVAGEAPWSQFVNTYIHDGLLAAQLVHNRDATATATEWDTGDVEPWLVRQTLMAPDQAILSTTELGHDGSGRISFGPAAEGNLLLTNVDGHLAFVPAHLAEGGTVAFVPAEGDVVRPLTPQLLRILGGGAAGGGAFLIGMTAFPSPAGGDTHQPLSDDVRLRFSDDGRLPVVEQRVSDGALDFVTGGTWAALGDVPVTPGPADTLSIDADRLRGAIGEARFAALGNLDGLGISLQMQPVPVAQHDVPATSIFAGQGGVLYAPQGTVVDWSAPYAQAGRGQATVLELQAPGMRGLTWTSGDDRPMIGPLDIRRVDDNCPRFSDVHQVAVEADITVRALNPGLSPRDLGRLIHEEIARQVSAWPEIGIYTELGLLRGYPQRGAILPPGASRIDVLEDAGRGAVCIYDPKTGDAEMRPEQMLRYWREALEFRQGTTRVYVIPIYTKR